MNQSNVAQSVREVAAAVQRVAKEQAVEEQKLLDSFRSEVKAQFRRNFGGSPLSALLWFVARFP